MATKKKKAADKKPASRRKQIKQAAPKKTIKRAVSPARELNSVRTELRKARRPLYALNKKIKEAPSKYYERKYKKERNEFLANQGKKIDRLIRKRDKIKLEVVRYEGIRREKKSKQNKVYSLERQIRKAIDDKDLKKAEKLRYELLKHLGDIDKLREQLGVKLDKQKPEDFNKEEQDGGKGYLIDDRSPYAIWEAIKQLHTDLSTGAFRYFIINGKRFSGSNFIEITAEASAFWISSKKKTDGTPYVNRYLNIPNKSVKYLLLNS